MLHYLAMFKQRAYDVFGKYLQTLVERIKNDYFASGLKATGFYGENVEWFLQDKGPRLIGRIEVPHYAQYMTFGREPTKKSEGGILYGIIRNWVDIKPGVPPPGWTADSFAYVVTQRIHREGIQVPNPYNPGDVTTKAVDNFIESELQQFIDDVGVVAVNTIQSDLIPDILAKFRAAQNST